MSIAAVPEGHVPDPPKAAPMSAVVIKALVAAALVAVAASLLGSVLAPSLLERHPLVLLGIDSRNRHLALATAAGVSLPALAVVGFLRLVIADPVFYLLGRHRGTQALVRLEHELPAATRHLGRAEALVRRGGSLFVFLAPNNAVCAAAGHVGMRPLRFVLLDVAGTMARLGAVWIVGKRFATPLDWLLEAVTANKVVITAVLAGLVVLQLRRARGQRPSS